MNRCAIALSSVLSLLCLLVFAAAPLQAAEEARVKANVAKVQSKPRPFGKTIARIKRGTRVLVLDKSKKAWLRIKTKAAAAITGWVRSGSMEEPKFALVGGQKGASEQETSLAGSGWNPQVEAQYKGKHPNLAPFYTKVDSIERDPVYKVDDTQAQAFLDQGGVNPRE